MQKKKKKILKWPQNYIQNIANKQLMALSTLPLMANSNLLQQSK
jgi:hypothetical protein